MDAFVAQYSQFRSEVAAGSLGKTGQLWIAYMDLNWLVLDLAQAVKTNNFQLYTHSLHKIADLFFSVDRQNYSRFLTFFSVILANV